MRIATAWQGRGIGASVVRWVVTESAKPVVLRVLKVNERTKRLYEREGFSVVDETATHYVMQHS